MMHTITCTYIIYVYKCKGFGRLTKIVRGIIQFKCTIKFSDIACTLVHCVPLYGT